MKEEELLEEIASLRKTLQKKEDQLRALRKEKEIIQPYGLSNEEIIRYSRQILVPEFGLKGQLKMKKASVLIVGAGGLGCPAALYLVGAGIGTLGIVDYDDVEMSNLHRQLLYSEADIGSSKVESTLKASNKLNSNVKIDTFKMQLNSENALKVLEKYDIVLDATDNVATRYLLNDACVLQGKPLVSGSALKFEGQLTVYNFNGPCYRCIFPEPPPPESVTNCGDGGVLGAAVGTIGVLQALEAIKIILNLPEVLSGKLLIFDGIETTFRKIRLRPKNQNCVICSNNATMNALIDYEQFCGAKASDKNPNLHLLNTNERISVEKYSKEIKLNTSSSILIDVRSPEEFEICRLNNSINIPIGDVDKPKNLSFIANEIQKMKKLSNDDPVTVFLLCRRGNDSQRAAKKLQNLLNIEGIEIKDIEGGIHAWARKVDNSFPIY